MSSTDNHSWYHWEGECLILQIHLQPRAKRDEMTGPKDGYLRIRVTAPPVDNKANTQLIRFLAKTFRVAPSRIRVLAGKSSRQKRLAIDRPEKLVFGINPAKTN